MTRSSAAGGQRPPEVHGRPPPLSPAASACRELPPRMGRRRGGKVAPLESLRAGSRVGRELHRGPDHWGADAREQGVLAQKIRWAGTFPQLTSRMVSKRLKASVEARIWPMVLCRQGWASGPPGEGEADADPLPRTAPPHLCSVGLRGHPEAQGSGQGGHWLTVESSGSSDGGCHRRVVTTWKTPLAAG